MVRSLWLLLSTLAVANVLAIAGLFGWLGATDRLNTDRLQEVRALFSQTVAEEAADEQAAELEVQHRSAEELAADGKGGLPIPAQQKNAALHEQDEILRQRIARSEREQQDLLRIAVDGLAELEKAKEKFEEDKVAWEAMRERLTAQESTEQFQKAVKGYQALKADVAKDLLTSLIDMGERGQVISYLNAMSERSSAKIINAFAQDDPVLAADLLEGIRTFGIETPDQGPTTDDNASQSSLAANP